MLIQKGIVNDQLEFIDLCGLWCRMGTMFNKRWNEIAASLGSRETMWTNHRRSFSFQNIVKLIAAVTVRLLNMSGRRGRPVDPHQFDIVHVMKPLSDICKINKYLPGNLAGNRNVFLACEG